MLRMTQQREIILEELKKFPGHPTADELYEKVKILSMAALSYLHKIWQLLVVLGI